MPFPRAADSGLLEHHLHVIEIDFAAERLLHAIDDARRAGEHTVKVIARVIPKSQLRLVASRVFAAINIARKTWIFLREVQQLFDFAAVEQAANGVKSIAAIFG